MPRNAKHLSHRGIYAYIETSTTGKTAVQGGQWTRAQLYQISKTTVGPTVKISCYLISTPEHYFRFQFGSGDPKDFREYDWQLEDDYLMHMYFDGQSDELQSIDFHKEAAACYNPLSSPGIFTEDKAKLLRFLWKSRSESAYEINDGELPLGVKSVDELSCCRMSFHKCELTGAKESRPEDCGLDEDDKAVVSSRGIHARLSEYFALSEPLDKEEEIQEYFGEDEYSPDVEVYQNVAEHPWLEFLFFYKSAELLEELRIKPKVRRPAANRASSSSQPEGDSQGRLNEADSISPQPMPFRRSDRLSKLSQPNNAIEARLHSPGTREESLLPLPSTYPPSPRFSSLAPQLSPPRLPSPRVPGGDTHESRTAQFSPPLSAQSEEVKQLPYTTGLDIVKETEEEEVATQAQNSTKSEEEAQVALARSLRTPSPRSSEHISPSAINSAGGSAPHQIDRRISGVATNARGIHIPSGIARQLPNSASSDLAQASDPSTEVDEKPVKTEVDEKPVKTEIKKEEDRILPNSKVESSVDGDGEVSVLRPGVRAGSPFTAYRTENVRSVAEADFSVSRPSFATEHQQQDIVSHSALPDAASEGLDLKLSNSDTKPVKREIKEEERPIKEEERPSGHKARRAAETVNEMPDIKPKKRERSQSIERNKPLSRSVKQVRK